MIGYVRGTVTGIFAGSCFVDVHGVGYRVYVPNGTRDMLVEGEEVQLRGLYIGQSRKPFELAA